MGMIQDFQKADEERRSEVATMIKEFAKADTERASEVTAMLGEFAQGDTERRTEVWGKAPPKKVAAHPVEELPGELGDRVFTYLADHPAGTKLVELEEEFGVARIQIARAIRELKNNNKVNKRGLLYFAI